MHKSPANQALARVRRTFKVRELDHFAGLQLGSPTRSVYAWHPRIVQLRVASALHATKHISTLADDYEAAAANNREGGGGHFRRCVGCQLFGGEAVELAVAGRPTAVIGRPDFVAAKPPVRPLPTHLTGGFATRPAAAFLDLEMFPPAGLTTVVKPTKMPA